MSVFLFEKVNLMNISRFLSLSLLLASSFISLPSLLYAAQNPDDSNVKSAKSAKQRIAANQQRRNFEFSDLGNDYSDFKNMLNNRYGIDYSIDISYMPQWGAPSGKHNANQTIIYPSLTWTMFNNEYGTGSLNMAYNIVRYGNSSASSLGNRLGVVTGINDYTSRSNSFDELYYSYTLGGKWSWLTVALGQFPLYNFDGTTYDSNQQVNFINEALSQNASSTYSTAGIGSYVQINPNQNWSFTLGAQDATNVEGVSVRTNDLNEAHYTTFASISYSPTIEGLGQGQYSLLVYNQPWVEEQKETTNGWSLNLSQDIGEKLSLFARMNGSSGNVAEINQSYVFGGVYNNPFDRNPLDQIGLAYAYNKINEDAVGQNLENSAEQVVETYWAWGISKWMTITPGYQLLINPALNAKSDLASVFSLRMTVFF